MYFILRNYYVLLRCVLLFLLLILGFGVVTVMAFELTTITNIVDV